MESSEIINKFRRKFNLLLIDQNEIKESFKLGEGGFAKVYKGKFKNIPVAIKKLRNFDYKQLKREIIIISKIRHKNIPKLYGLIYDEKKEKISLVFEYIDGVTLSEYLKLNHSMDIVQKLIICLELCSTLCYLHSINLIHRDIKPSNIMINQSLNLKLLDFGISKLADRSRTTTLMKGTLTYMAPENFQTNINEKKIVISTKVDSWSFGCIISEIFSGEKPWAILTNDDKILISFLFQKKQFPIPQNIKYNNVIPLISNCVETNYEKRYCMIKAYNSLLATLCNEMVKYSLDSDKYVQGVFTNNYISNIV
jgi:serine/threonine protein kinase